MPPPKRRALISISNLNGGSSEKPLKRQRTAENSELGGIGKENVGFYSPIITFSKQNNHFQECLVSNQRHGTIPLGEQATIAMERMQPFFLELVSTI